MANTSKQPTIKETLKAINVLYGIHAKYNSEYKEFQVSVIGNPDSMYFTEDRGDALMTAVKMSEHVSQIGELTR